MAKTTKLIGLIKEIVKQEVKKEVNKIFISEEINKLLRLTPIKTNEWDVHLGI